MGSLRALTARRPLPSVSFEVSVAYLIEDWSMLHSAAVATRAYDTVQMAPEDIVAKLAAKQHDYGHGNIMAFGELGIRVRISDKWARIRNLRERQVAPEHESLHDSWFDLLGYCVIGDMLTHGTFQLPLHKDRHQP